MSELDFNAYLEKWEDQLLARVLLTWGLVDQQSLRASYQEKQRISSSGEACKLGQMLIRKRLLQIPDYTRAMLVVRQQAQVLYQKALAGNQVPDSKMQTRQHQTAQAAANHNTLLRQQQAAAAKADRAGVGRAESSTQMAYPQQEQVAKDSSDLGHKGSCFGNYEIVEEIARGGMGIVYKARQLHLNRIVALKVLLSGGAASEMEIQRFRREAESAGSLQHPNIVSIYEIGEQDGYHYFTMDYIEGETLQALIKKRARRKKMIQMVEKVARALDHAHRRGVVHRDIKPSNVIVSPEWEPKITDFGLAKKLDANTMLTESGTTLGTPFYMAPEQTLGQKDVDGRADIYSMGVILYEIMTHRLPFNAGTLVELYHKVVEEDPIPPTKLNRKVDREIELVCLKCMEKDPARRYQAAEDLANDLKRYLNGEAVIAKRASAFYRISRKVNRHRHAFLIGVAVILLLVPLVFIFMQSPESEQERKQIEAKMLLEQGKAKIKNGNFLEGLNKMEQAIKIFPQLKQAYIARGDAYLSHSEYLNALTEYDRVLKIDEKYAPAYYGKGRAYFGLKKHEKAIEHYTKAINYRKDYIEAYVGRGNAYQDKGMTNSSSQDLEKAIGDHERADRLKRNHIDKGNEYFGKKKYLDSLNEYQRVLEVDDKYSQAYYGKGKVFLAQKKWKESIDNLALAIKYNPESLDAYKAREKAYRNTNQLDKAENDRQKIQMLQKN